MNLLIYIGIFLFKVIEEALRTLRIIVVSNGKKILGAILQFFIALIWIIVTGIVIIDIKKHPLEIIVYCFGSLIGSYIGSLIEEKLAMGTNMVIVEVGNDVADNLINILKIKKYKINILKSYKESHKLLMITSARKKTSEVIKIIKSYDKRANIISEKVKISN